MRALTIATACLLLGACGTTDPDSPTVAYRDAESAESLVVPPDLTQPDTSQALEIPELEKRAAGSSAATASASASEPTARAGGESADAVLPRFDEVRFVRFGDSVWLEVENASPAALWPRAKAFFESQGLEIARAQPALGIVETEWVERNDGPGSDKGFLANLFMGESDPSVRDRYQIRLERLDDGGTRVFLTHRRAHKVALARGPQQPQEYLWERSGGDPAVEAEMTRRFQVYLGVTASGGDPTEAMKSETDEPEQSEEEAEDDNRGFKNFDPFSRPF